MTFQMIERARDQWFKRADCPVADFVRGIRRIGKLRDAQIDAMKTYLFLKVAGDNKPLHELYDEGLFNDNLLNPDDLSINARLRNRMIAEPGMQAMYEYLKSVDVDGRSALDYLEHHAEDVDHAAFFRTIMDNESYTDYIFSLPMGAGKTYLMAAFIYIDLYFSASDPGFAENFIVFAPSGTKSSVMPSLKTIQTFDPAWLFNGPVADQLRKQLQFEVLDAVKTDAKSNKTRNPNVRKLLAFSPLEHARGLVLVTNAEKVILDSVRTDPEGFEVAFDRSNPKSMADNELRMKLGKLPRLSILIDEVHHASNNDVKLRAVVTGWANHGNNVISVLGFSGTPFEKSKKKVSVNGIHLKRGLLPHVVHFYPLTQAVGNFLKRPVVHRIDGEAETIIRAGLRGFFDEYLNTVYPDGTCAKIAIYCGNVARLEETVWPLVAEIVKEYGLNPSESILKYHRGGTAKKKYPLNPDAEFQFSMLDTPYSHIRVVLLVGIAKEGWDCHSLTGVILSQKGDSPQNMVLQTTCRCLRQAGLEGETAGIWLNEFNADKLEAQLKQSQHATLADFQNGTNQPTVKVRSRMEVLKVPPIDAYLYRLVETSISEPIDRRHVSECMPGIADACTVSVTETEYRDLHMDYAVAQHEANVGSGITVPITFRRWLSIISRECAGDARVRAMLHDTENQDSLHDLFRRITSVKGGAYYLRPNIDQEAVRSMLRVLAYPKREASVSLETIDKPARLCVVDESKLPRDRELPRNEFYPDENEVQNILGNDARPGDRQSASDADKAYQALVEALGQEKADTMWKGLSHADSSNEDSSRTYQYLPYRFDSSLEQRFYQQLMKLDELKERGIEVYYNGDTVFAKFRIHCYKKTDKYWRSIGLYTPDFLLVKRGATRIDKTLIIETKGSGFSDNSAFTDRRNFIEHTFVPGNRALPGGTQFDYLYIQDSESEQQQRAKVLAKVEKFFD